MTGLVLMNFQRTAVYMIAYLWSLIYICYQSFLITNYMAFLQGYFFRSTEFKFVLKALSTSTPFSVCVKNIFVSDSGITASFEHLNHLYSKRVLATFIGFFNHRSFTEKGMLHFSLIRGKHAVCHCAANCSVLFVLDSLALFERKDYCLRSGKQLWSLQEWLTLA